MKKLELSNYSIKNNLDYIKFKYFIYLIFTNFDFVKKIINKQSSIIYVILISTLYIFNQTIIEYSSIANNNNNNEEEQQQQHAGY